MGYRIKEVSDISGISIRMMRHYDKTGLLKPEGVLSNGYRNYSSHDLDRLQKIMFLRELEFSINDMKKILDGSSDDMVKALIGQKKLLLQKRERLDKIIDLIGKSINGEEFTKNMDKFKAFDMKEIYEHKKKYAKETEKKYSGTKEYEQSMKRTSKYTKDDWERINNEAKEIYIKIAGMMYKQADNPKVLSAIGEWKSHISKYYYECTDEIFVGLAQMYVEDLRFTENIDKYGEGLAKFMSKAMIAYCKY